MEFDWCLCLIGLVACEGVGADAKLDSSGNITDTRQGGKYNLMRFIKSKTQELKRKIEDSPKTVLDMKIDELVIQNVPDNIT